jgi:hypothetical protein
MENFISLMNKTIPPYVLCLLFSCIIQSAILGYPTPQAGELKCYLRIAHSESECIKVLLESSPPTSGETKMIHKNQYFKELFSQQPVHEGRMKAVQS